MKKIFKLLLVTMIMLCLFGCNTSKHIKKVKRDDSTNSNDDISESNVNNSISQNSINSQNLVVIDLKPEWLKYRDITLNRDYLSNKENNIHMIDDGIDYDGREEFYNINNIGVEETNGVEIYGIYFDNIEINEEIPKESTVLYNFPSTIDGKDVISIVFSIVDTRLINRKINGKEITKAEVNLPEKVILISGINANLIHVNDGCKYVSQCWNLDCFNNNMVLFNGSSFFIECTELLLGNNIVLADGAGITVCGHVEKAIIDGVITSRDSGIYFDNDFAFSEFSALLPDYDNWYIGDIYVNSSIANIECDEANSLHLGDNIEVKLVKYENNIKSLNYVPEMIFEIGKNVILDVGDEHLHLCCKGVKKLIIGTPIVLGDISVDKKCQIVNKTGAEIQWGNFIRGNSGFIEEQTFKSGRLDMGDFFIEVTEE